MKEKTTKKNNPALSFTLKQDHANFLSIILYYMSFISGRI